jgi:hypothetical protein
MTLWTKVWLADGTEAVVKLHPSVIEEAADNEEVVSTTDGHLIDLTLVERWAPQRFTY